MDILDPKLESYLSGLFPEEDPLHGEMERFASQRTFSIGQGKTIPFPIIGKLVGRLVYQLARMVKARRVLELGSGFGYSGYWFSRAIGPQGELTLTEGSKQNLDDAKKFLGRLPSPPKIDFRQGDALEILETLPGEFDVVFIDIDKHQYPEAFKKAGPRVKKGGLFIADNTLWGGEVLEPQKADKNAKGIIEFNRLISSSKDFIASIVPLRDGVAACLKP